MRSGGRRFVVMIDPREIEIEKHVVEALDETANRLKIDAHELASRALEAFTTALDGRKTLRLPLVIKVETAR